MSQGSIAIIGGGVVGLCSAYYLAHSGFKVAVIERDTFSKGASLGNAGMIVPSHFVPLTQPGMISKGLRWIFNPESPFSIKPALSKDLMKWGWQFYRHANSKHVDRSMDVLMRLNLFSKSLYQQMVIDFGGFQLQNKGLIMYCKTKEKLNEEIKLAQKAHHLGMKAEILDRDGLINLDPNIEIDVFGGVYFPEDAFLSPSNFIQALLGELKKLGVQLLERMPVSQFYHDGQQVTGLQAGESQITADQYVIAAGTWSDKVSKDLRLNIMMQSGKGYSFNIPNPVQLPGICSILTEAKVAVTPMGNTLRVAGTMEIGNMDESINTKKVVGIKKSVSSYFPQFKNDHFMDLDIWTGLRPCSPDGLPYLGRTKKYNNLIVASGHGMMGMSMGPITGKLVSELALQKDTIIVLDQLSPDRYR